METRGLRRRGTGAPAGKSAPPVGNGRLAKTEAGTIARILESIVAEHRRAAA
jgi:hypothetical protein